MKTKRVSPRKQTTSKKSPPDDVLHHYRLLMDFMDNIPDVIYFKDTKGRLLLVNKAHAKGLGLKPQDVVGKTDFDIFPKERAERMAKDDAYVIKTGKPIIDKIERGTRADGVDNYVSTTKIPRYDSRGRLVGMLGITRDVTKRIRVEQKREARTSVAKKLEMLEDLNKIKSEFISTVSHELITPLSIIKQLHALIFEETAGPLNDRQREVLVKIRRNIDRLKTIIDELLDISRIERKQLKLHYALVNLNDLFRESEDYFKELAGEKNIELTYVLPAKGVSIFVDVERLVQIVTNLINNAVKFTEENGKIKVEVKVLETKVRIGVIDTGTGIAKADLPKVFGKFVQVTDGKEPRRRGIGLGLSIVRELVERHGGEIWVESKVGVGSKFYFTLPRYYTAKILGKSVQDIINSLLKKNLSVYLVNLMIVNFDEFHRRVDVGPQTLSRNVKAIIDDAYQEFTNRGTGGKHRIFVTNMHRGRYNIVFSQTTDKKVAAFCELLKERTKDYFNQHKIDNVFIALGILSYAVKAKTLGHKDIPAKINIKEVYIGSEMRRFKRVQYQTVMDVITNDQKKIKAKTVDISEGGVCFLAPKSLKTDSLVKVQFNLLRKQQPFLARGRVSWIKKMERTPARDEEYKIGVEFTVLESPYKSLFLNELKLYYE